MVFKSKSNAIRLFHYPNEEEYPASCGGGFTGTLIDMDQDIIHFKNGFWHSLSGPAIIYRDGDKRYYICGMPYTKEDWERIKDEIQNEKT